MTSVQPDDSATATRNRPRVVVVDDDDHIRRAVRDAIDDVAIVVAESQTGWDGIEATRSHQPDVVILDLGLPDISGLEVCVAIRGVSTVPILVLTARSAESETVALLNAGADDYVIKPFATTELAARVGALYRRSQAHRAAPPAVVESNGLRIDLTRRTVTRGDESIRLTPIEWEILKTLASDAGRVFTHQQLFDAVWGRQYGDARLYLRVHLTNLRRKIERDPANPRILITEPGVGYRFDITQ